MILAVALGFAYLTWEPPTTRADGSTLPRNEIAGFRVYRGSSPKSLALHKETTGTSYRDEGLSAGIYYYSITTFNIFGAESDLSAVVSKTIIDGTRKPGRGAMVLR